MDPNFSLLHLLQSKSLSRSTLIFITNTISYLDGKHVVFGEVLEGYEIVEKIENVPKGSGDKPKSEVKITKSGELPVPEEGIHEDL